MALCMQVIQKQIYTKTEYVIYTLRSTSLLHAKILIAIVFAKAPFLSSARELKHYSVLTVHYVLTVGC